MSLQECKEDYERRFRGEAYAPIGATEEEVRAVEKRMGLTFPKEYRDFLLWMGNDRDGILRDGYWYLDDIERLTKNLGSWLERNGIARPEGKYVCCYCWQGYVYGWFLVTPDEEDPDMYLYNECDKARPKPSYVGTFTDWLEEVMEGSRVDVWKQFYARQEYDAAQAAKNGGLNSPVSKIPASGGTNHQGTLLQQGADRYGRLLFAISKGSPKVRVENKAKTPSVAHTAKVWRPMVRCIMKH